MTEVGEAVALEVKALGFRFPGAPVHLWENLTFEVKKGEAILVAGGNGSGKSTLLDVLQGRRRTTNGVIRMFGRDVSSWPSWRRAARWVARGFQDVRCPGRLKAWEVIALGIPGRFEESLLRTVLPLQAKLRRQRFDERRERAVAALRDFGCPEIADTETRALSGGQRKIVEYGLLSMRPSSIYLLDEPLMGLSADRCRQAARFCRELLERGRSLVIVEHGDRSQWLGEALGVEKTLRLD